MPLICENLRNLPTKYSYADYADFPKAASNIVSYWVKRIPLNSGQIVTECELRPDENLFAGLPPVLGDIIEVTCRGKNLKAKVVWVNQNLPKQASELYPIRVQEL